MYKNTHTHRPEGRTRAERAQSLWRNRFKLNATINFVIGSDLREAKDQRIGDGGKDVFVFLHQKGEILNRL